MSDDRRYLKLYLVTDRDLAAGRPLIDVIERALDGGVTAVQLREKGLSTREFVAEAHEVKQRLAASRVPLFINDRVDVALAAAAEGVHVGQDDLPAATARSLIGPDMLLGVSVATDEEARSAIADGADYVSVSPVFLTPTKSDADQDVGLDGIRRIRAAVADHPVLAIGGIDASNARSVVEAGSDGVAVVSAIVAAADPEAVSRVIRFEVEAGLEARGVTP
jgi:thiamine-phosphate pyrophosphorylase